MVADQALEKTGRRFKKYVKMVLSLFRRGFNSSKCITKAKMATARIKLLRNKRDAVIRQMRRDVALLLQSHQDSTARIRVEHVIREQNIMAANEIIELFCDLIVSRISMIAKQRECPADLKEGISSLLFAAARCADIPELVAIRGIFEKKYGKDFVSAATDLRPSCGVNCTLIEKLSVKTPSGEVKLKLLKEIAKEYQIEWDLAETMKELLRPLEEPLLGPNTFVSATTMPVKQLSDHLPPGPRDARDNGSMGYGNAKQAAKAAAESAMKALAAAEAASYLATQSSNQNVSHLKNTDDDGGGGGDDDEPLKRRTCENARMGRRHTFNMDSGIQFDDSDPENETEVEIERKREPSSGAGAHVHPNLPDYETLATRFEALKHRNSLP